VKKIKIRDLSHSISLHQKWLENRFDAPKKTVTDLIQFQLIEIKDTALLNLE